MKVQAGGPIGQQIRIELELGSGQIVRRLKAFAIGDLSFLAEVKSLVSKYQGQKLMDLPIPQGESPAAVLLRMCIRRAQGRWQPPYREAELCHCRAVPTEKVELAIAYGAHSSAEVSRWTSASTACGTCRPDVESMIEYILRESAA